jgi:hypothetical protein
MPKIRQSNTAVKERLSFTTKTDRAEVRVSNADHLTQYQKRWQPGESGNPGGKPKVLTEVLQMGYKTTPAIMQRLIDAALHSADANVWIPAAREVLNRTFGKPSQQVEVIGGVEHRHFVLRAPVVLESSEAWEAKYSDAPVIEHPASASDAADPSPRHGRDMDEDAQ